MGATVFPLGPGSEFVADERHVPEVSPYGAFKSESDLTAWVAEKWSILFELKRGETERLKQCELYYAGFHYIDPQENRNRPITNYCFSTVETVLPILTQSRPRPEPVPRKPMDAIKAKRLKDYCTYKMDSSGFDKVFRQSARDLLKYGWCCPMISWDSKGRALPRYLSPFDFYPDEAADESTMEMFAIAYPVSTRRLRMMYPKVAQRIQPDGIASPSYEVMVKPYNEMATYGAGASSLQMVTGTLTLPSAVFEDGSAATSTGSYGIDTGSFQLAGRTTFLIQLFCRDYTTMSVRYSGMKRDDTSDGPIENPYQMRRDEPCCPSGWRMIPMTASGVLLDAPRPVDECLGGIPLVIGRDYEIGGRFFGRGELDDVMPIQRAINYADTLLDRALDLTGNPPVIATKNCGIDVNKSEVVGGEVLFINQGHKIDYMQPQGIADSHFMRRAARRQDIQIVSGTPDSLQGQRPVGVEAASAIRMLTQSAASRARAKGSGMLEWAALLLQKMVHSDLRKSQEMPYFVPSDGSTDGVFNLDDYDPSDFDIRWASSTGDAQGEQDRVDKDLELFQLGIIDAQQVLENEDYPNRIEILQRVGFQRMQEAAAAQAAAASQNGNGNGGPPKGGQ